MLRTFARHNMGFSARPVSGDPRRNGIATVKAATAGPARIAGRLAQNAPWDRMGQGAGAGLLSTNDECGAGTFTASPRLR
jgi:hypothetical protein